VSASCCAHRIQSLFNSLGDEVKGSTIGLGGDGRYWNKQATQIILKIAAAAGVKKVRCFATEHAATVHDVKVL
jgi:phosphoglucomutase